VASPGAAIAGGNLCYGVARNAAVKISRISKRCRGIVYSSVSGAVLADLLCAVSLWQVSPKPRQRLEAGLICHRTLEPRGLPPLGLITSLGRFSGCGAAAVGPITSLNRFSACGAAAGCLTNTRLAAARQALTMRDTICAKPGHALLADCWAAPTATLTCSPDASLSGSHSDCQISAQWRISLSRSVSDWKTQRR
jgi:hypothetical protein